MSLYYNNWYISTIIIKSHYFWFDHFWHMNLFRHLSLNKTKVPFHDFYVNKTGLLWSKKLLSIHDFDIEIEYQGQRALLEGCRPKQTPPWRRSLRNTRWLDLWTWNVSGWHIRVISHMSVREQVATIIFGTSETSLLWYPSSCYCFTQNLETKKGCENTCAPRSLYFKGHAMSCAVCFGNYDASVSFEFHHQVL